MILYGQIRKKEWAQQTNKISVKINSRPGGNFSQAIRAAKLFISMYGYHYK